MADELELELEDNDDVEKRIRTLSNKVKLTSEERDEKQHLLETKDAELATVQKERDFFKDFSGSISKYPGASEYQDAIKEKVMSGYTVEDATVAVLNKEGKLQAYTPPTPKENPAGGSAITNTGSGEKPLDEMTKEEKRAALIDSFGGTQ